jgi:hypothetical protein
MAKSFPKIRVFISSTFLDMQRERDVLNLEVFPVVKGVCDQLGVAFNVIDLRWGITEEDQAQGSVIDLCLDEIQHCKPYFIGLIGNRYGWIPDTFDPDLKEKFQFIKEDEDRSVTELEMVLGALSEENRDRCFFYYKDPQLFDAETDDHHQGKIEGLKNKINKLDIHHSDYSSFEQFKESVLNDLLEAIRTDYPEDRDMMDIKQEAYLNLKESGHVKRFYFAMQAFDIITYAEENHVAVAAIAPYRLGKTATFNHIINIKPDADKIIINFEADVNMQYFPGHYLYWMIKIGLEKYGYNLHDYEDFPIPEVLNNYESNIQALLAFLKRNLYAIEYKRPLYILINDANLFFSNDPSKTFYRNFIFDDTRLPDNLHVIVTTNSEPDVPLVCANLHASTDDPKQFFTEYLSQFAKKIDKDILDTANQNLQFTDYKFIADYLIYYCNFSSYKQVARELLSKSNFVEVLQYIYDDFISHMSAKCASVFTEILLRLHIFRPGLSETALFASYDRATAIEETEYQVYVDLIEIEKAAILRPLRYFTSVESGTIFISDPFIKYFIAKNIGHLTSILQRTNAERTRKAYDEFYERHGGIDAVVQGGKIMRKEDYVDAAVNGNEANTLMTYAVLDPLCAYLNKIIMDYAKELENREDAFNVETIEEKEIKMLVYIQEAAKLYKLNTRANLYSNILSNIELMLFVCSKSHLLFRRLIAGYIELNTDLQKAQYSHVDEHLLSFTVNYALDSLVKADKEKFDELNISDAIDNAILVLEEHGMLDGELNRLSEEEDGGMILMNDYIVNACSDEAQQCIYDIDYESYDEDCGHLLELVDQLAEKLDKTPNTYDKILYAFYFFKLSIKLIDEGNMPETTYYGTVQETLKKIRGIIGYCFFPEVCAFFDIFLGRLYLGKHIELMRRGLDVMKSLGFQSSIEDYEDSYSYFKKQA